MRILHVGLLTAALGSACGTSPKPTASHAKDASSPHVVQILSADRVAAYRAMLPSLGDSSLSSKLADGRAVFYDKDIMPPGYQDSMGDPVGMRPNTIAQVMIDTAVPGGHARLFQRHGVFNFPFGTGGMDRASNGGSFNFWIPPVKNGEILPVTYFSSGFTRWQWVFPVGTIIGEVLTMTLPDGTKLAFEVRTRERLLTGWKNDIFRPFNTAQSLADAVKARRNGWAQDSDLAGLVAHLEDSSSLTPRTLSTTFFVGAFPTLEGSLDLLPDFGDASLVKDLLRTTRFTSAKGIAWKSSGGMTAHAASSASGLGITATNYDGGMLNISDEDCARCHKDAGRSINDFHPDLAAYGELWGEDQIFSWHPFEIANFANPDGTVNNFNDNNRVLRSEFQASGLVQPYDPARHTEEDYKQLSHEWTYNPF